MQQRQITGLKKNVQIFIEFHRSENKELIGSKMFEIQYVIGLIFFPISDLIFVALEFKILY